MPVHHRGRRTRALERAVAYEVRKALNIPEDVPLTLNIKQE
ncbi:hypothetical protein P3T35_000914 [Kitasatospora sp. GP30]|nr:hypothetical protein [Kitasatospora sp. GP30]MDH6138925.1 hypothetical protein [Kitasatospora sp. GP30]